MLHSSKLRIGQKYKVKADLEDAPSSFVRGEVVTFLRATNSATNAHVICEFRAQDNSLKYLDLSDSGCSDWRELLAPVGWLS